MKLPQTVPLFGMLLSLALLLPGCGRKPSAPAGSANASLPQARTDPAESSVQPEAAAPTPKDLLADLPAAVQQTVRAQLGEAELLSVESDTEEGETVFEATVTREGITRTFSVSKDGTLLQYQVFESELPAAVRSILQGECPIATLGPMERESDQGTILYSIDLIQSGRTNGLTVAADGAWWSLEIALAQAPTPVQQSVRRLWGNLAIGDARKSSEDGDILYEFESDQAGRHRSLAVTAAGQVVGRGDELKLNEVPFGLRSTIQRQIGNGDLLRVSRTTSEDGVSYDVDYRKDGKDRTISLDLAGKVIPEGEELPPATGVP